MENALDMGDEAFRLAKKRRYSEALAICDKIIANWPRAYVGHYHKAVILQAKGELSDALKSMTRVVELMPQDAFPYYMRAGILMQMGRYSDALGDLVEAEDRDEERFLGSEIPLLKADCHCQLDQLDQAERLCDAVPDDYVSYAVKGSRRGTKHTVLDEIRRRRGCGCS